MKKDYFDGLEKNEVDFFLKSDYGSRLNKKFQQLVTTGKISEEKLCRVLFWLVRQYYSFFNDPKNAWQHLGMCLNEFPDVFDITELLLLEVSSRQFIMPSNPKNTELINQIFNHKNVKFQYYHKKYQGNEVDFYVIYEPITKKIWYEETFGEAFHIIGESGFQTGLYFYTNDENAGCIHLIHGYLLNSVEKGWGNGGLRPDLNKGFKSSWEANIARLLNYLNIDWEYELATNCFAVEVKSGTTYYHPDFKVFKKDNSYYWFEVKGFWNQKSLEKVRSFYEKYPNERIELIDNDIYYMLQEKYSSIIPHWEQQTVISHSVEKMPVVGITFNNRIKTINLLSIGDKLILRREPDNKYDLYAIQVLTQNGQEVGYICREWATIYSYKMLKEMNFDAYLESKHLEDKHLIIRVERVGEINPVVIEKLFETQ